VFRDDLRTSAEARLPLNHRIHGIKRTASSQFSFFAEGPLSLFVIQTENGREFEDSRLSNPTFSVGPDPRNIRTSLRSPETGFRDRP